MTRLGMILRADEGGLAAQTCEAARHLQCSAAVVVDLGSNGRGATALTRVDVANVRVARENPISDSAVSWLTSRCDVIFTAETAYHDQMHALCSDAGVRLVIQANPELHKAIRTADLLVNPTNYGADRYDWPVLPVPTCLDRIPFRRRRGNARRFLHICSPAMADRNGTALVIDALASIRQEVTVRFVGGGPFDIDTPANVTVEWGEPTEFWWENYTPDIDVLLMPRRYAGLCLPAQEAATAGIPTIALGTVPLRETCYPVPAFEERDVKMVSGFWPVNTCNPRDLAGAIDAFARSDDLLGTWSIRARAWAEQISWENLLPRYRRVLALDE